MKRIIKTLSGLLLIGIVGIMTSCGGSDANSTSLDGSDTGVQSTANGSRSADELQSLALHHAAQAIIYKIHDVEVYLGDEQWQKHEELERGVGTADETVVLEQLWDERDSLVDDITGEMVFSQGDSEGALDSSAVLDVDFNDYTLYEYQVTFYADEESQVVDVDYNMSVRVASGSIAAVVTQDTTLGSDYQGESGLTGPLVGNYSNTSDITVNVVLQDAATGDLTTLTYVISALAVTSSDELGDSDFKTVTGTITVDGDEYDFEELNDAGDDSI